MDTTNNNAIKFRARWRTGAVGAVLALAVAGAFAQGSRPAAAAAAPALPTMSAEQWRQAAVADVEAAYLTTLDDHPGTVDPANPDFARNLEKAREGGHALAARVRDAAGYAAALQHFNALLGDGRAGVVLKDMPPAPPRWPGFITAWRGDNMFVAATTPGGPAVGARIADCDGKPIAQLVETNVFGFGQRSGGTGPWWTFAPDVFIDQGNPFITLPVQCIFIDEGRESRITLSWRAMDDAARRLRDDSFNGVTQPIGISTPRPKLYWFALPTFQPGETERAAYHAMLAEAQASRPRYLEADALVIDLRGNQGGDAGWALKLARTLWGEARVNRRVKVAQARQAVLWRASFGNIAYTSFESAQLTDKQRSQLGYDPAVISQGMLAAQSRDEKFYPDPARRDAVSDSDRAENLPGDPPPLTRPVYVVVPGQCTGACLEALDVFSLFPNTKRIGAPSAADSSYTGIRLEPLKSGLASVIVPSRVVVNRPRSVTTFYTPAIAVNDLEWSQRAFLKAIEADLVRR
ncbi:hypothetical protein ASF61_15430 [Duganella sp. Leaf126]|uniref:hypothetical protein n=1 Tax=Duganella sp. Leaf126 TaxID=1736266 RepID=UPI0006FF1C5D|nr:hypothetical protein [Duganella sp. Leaf126]KQQ32421.1 hypothetical protein ASF61_15430 [Duganella sp. Leaf126]